MEDKQCHNCRMPLPAKKVQVYNGKDMCFYCVFAIDEEASQVEQWYRDWAATGFAWRWRMSKHNRSAVRRVCGWCRYVHHSPKLKSPTFRCVACGNMNSEKLGRISTRIREHIAENMKGIVPLK